MNRTIQIALMCFAIIAAALAGYAYGTSRTERNIAQLMQGVNVYSSASSLITHLRVLTKLREGNHDKAIDILERLTDVDLSSLGVYAQSILASKDQETLAHVKAAKEYRAKYPPHKIDDNLLISVNKALDLVK